MVSMIETFCKDCGQRYPLGQDHECKKRRAKKTAPAVKPAPLPRMTERSGESRKVRAGQANERVDDLGSVQDARKMSSDGQPSSGRYSEAPPSGGDQDLGKSGGAANVVSPAPRPAAAPLVDTKRVRGPEKLTVAVKDFLVPGSMTITTNLPLEVLNKAEAAAAHLAPKRGRGRPRGPVPFDKKAHDRQKSKERRAAKLLGKNK